MQMWNTSEGGPCFLRPTPPSSHDNPVAGKVISTHCIDGIQGLPPLTVIFVELVAPKVLEMFKFWRHFLNLDT